MPGQIQLQLSSYVHPCTNETHPPACLQDLIPTLAGIYDYMHPTRTSQSRDKSCRCAGECVSFVYECSYVYPAATVFDQAYVVSIGNAGW